MWVEGVLGGNGGGEGVAGVWARPWSLVQLMALTEVGLWPYSGRKMEREGGERGGRRVVCLHTEVCCPLGSLQHMAKSIRSDWGEEKSKTSTEKTGWKSTSLSVWEQVFSDWKLVTPPLTGDMGKCPASPCSTVFMMEQSWWRLQQSNLLLLCPHVLVLVTTSTLKSDYYTSQISEAWPEV